MEQDNQLGFEFPGLGRRKIEANFAGGQVSSDGGVDAASGGSLVGFYEAIGPDFARPTKPALNSTFSGKSSTPTHLWLGAGIRRP